MREEHDNHYHHTDPTPVKPQKPTHLVKREERQQKKEEQRLQKPELPKDDDARAEKKEKRKRRWYYFRKTFHVTYGTIKGFMMTIIVLLVAGLVFGAGIGCGYFAKLVHSMSIPSESQLDQRIHKLDQQSTMTYADGQLIGTLQSDIIRTKISNRDIPKLMKEAIIDTEDPNFYHHHGVVPKAVVRALAAQVLGVSTPSGGSTITQQLVKQQLLSNETTFERKAKEMLLALRIEKYFSKDDILTTYLNVTSFGRNNKGENIAGLNEAAKGIFGVKPEQLSLAQSAYLAGLPQSPIVYSPYNSLGQIKSKQELQYGLQRKDQVLLNMYREGDISYAEYKAAKKVDLTKQFIPSEAKQTKQYNYLYYAVRDQAVRALMPVIYERDGFSTEDINKSTDLFNRYYNITESTLSSNGYKVTSTIDRNIYNTMQKVVKENGALLDEKKVNDSVEVGNVLMDNETGRVYGFVGGRNFKANQNNHALQTKRSAASTMKPIIAYAPAVDIGLISNRTMLDNSHFAYSNGKEVTNYGHSRGYGFEPVEDALKYSHNIPVLDLYRQLLKEGNPYQYISDMNLGLTEKQVRYESSPLGTNDVTVLAQTGAYATLANKGQFNQPYLIEKIEDDNGNVVYEHEESSKQVFSEATASIMNNMMRHVLTDKDATGYRVQQQMKKVNKNLARGDWVGKTGTSEYNTDFWFIASTPKVTLSSWAGYDNNRKMTDHVRDANMDYWVKLASAIEKEDASILGLDEKFELSSDVIKTKVSAKTGTLPGTVKYEGHHYKTPKQTVTAYSAQSDAVKKATFRYGIGGSTAEYLAQWQSFK